MSLLESVPMSEPFSLTVPADPRYRGLGREVASKYVEMSGGSEADAAAFAEAVVDALNALAHGATNGAQIALQFRPTSSEIEVQLACGARTSVVRHRLPARKS